MSEGAITVDSLEGFDVGLNDAQLEKAAAGRATLENDKWYKFVVTAGAKVGISRKSGNMYLTLPVAPLDEDGNVAKPAMRHNVTLPWTTPESLLESNNLPADLQTTNKSKGAPNTSFLLAIYLRAVHGTDVFPVFPRRAEDGNIYFKGELVPDKETAQAIREEESRKIDNYFSAAVKSPDTFIGDEFWGMIGPQGDTDFQQIIVDLKTQVMIQHVLPEDAEIGAF